MNQAKHELSINWTEPMRSHFDTLKHRFQEGPVRGYPDFDNSEPFIIDTEFLGLNTTAVSSQKQGDKELFLGYVAKTCNKSHRTYSGHKGGLCAVVLGLHRFEQILKYRAFVIRTDPLCREYLNDMGKWKGMYARIQTFLSEFDYQVIHQREKLPGDADSLSNLNVLPELEGNKQATDEHTKPFEDRFNLYPTELFTFAEIRQAAQKDSTLQQIKAYVSAKDEPGPKEM